ncbi:MAG: DUF3662 domain-containing protein [Bifidobacteriaceae bacterium]|jgi:hypothetical protein|nr:DUF3662 domain-containing protein [Bifidobacteriaceae bacterium]
MGVFDDFEKKIEGAVNSAFSKFGSHDIKPTDFVLALKKELDAKVLQINQERNVVPNKFVITLSTPDFDKIEEWGASSFADELANELKDYVVAEDYATVGAITVTFNEDTDAEQGVYSIASEMVRGGIAQNPAESGFPTVEVNGKKFQLNKEVVTVGRDSTSDIVLDDSSISRQHLEFRVTPAGVIATDLGSTNGFYIGNSRITSTTLKDGDILSVGRLKLIYRNG